MLEHRHFCCLVVIFTITDRFIDCDITQRKDVYWMDYDGVIPLDAVQGGKIDGTATYIGQVLVPGVSGIIPVTIYPGRKTVTGTFYYVGTFDAHEYVKILCIKNKHKHSYKWLPAAINNFPNVSDLVIGGYDFGAIVYIGRAKLNDDNVIIGKVFEQSALHIPTHLNDQEHIDSYEVLAFVPESESENGAPTPGEKDYYWREYAGEIPEDAVEGGINAGVTTYIGLMPTKLGLIPGNILAGKLTASGEYYGGFETDLHVQILCSNNKQKLTWIDAEQDTVFQTEELVLGGIEGNLLTYIARAKHDDNLIVGKMFVMYNPHEANVMYIYHQGDSMKMDAFQVLSYKRN